MMQSDFKLKENKTNIQIEIIAGISTFLCYFLYSCRTDLLENAVRYNRLKPGQRRAKSH